MWDQTGQTAAGSFKFKRDKKVVSFILYVLTGCETGVTVRSNFMRIAVLSMFFNARWGPQTDFGPQRASLAGGT
jgi:hypothetical protein